MVGMGARFRAKAKELMEKENELRRMGHEELYSWGTESQTESPSRQPMDICQVRAIYGPLAAFARPLVPGPRLWKLWRPSRSPHLSRGHSSIDLVNTEADAKGDAEPDTNTDAGHWRRGTRADAEPDAQADDKADTPPEPTPRSTPAPTPKPTPEPTPDRAALPDVLWFDLVGMFLDVRTLHRLSQSCLEIQDQLCPQRVLCLLTAPYWRLRMRPPAVR